MIPERIARPRLSKSRYISGRQCSLRLWCDCYAAYLAGEPVGMQQATIRSGRAVGLLATDLFTRGVRVSADHEHHEAAVRETETLMADATVPAIFEAGFVHRDVRVRVDVLERAGDGWHVTEVKSGLAVKEISLDDLALQCWVLRGCEIDVRRAGILTLNRSYRRDDDLDLEGLFAFRDCSADVEQRAEQVAQDVEDFTAMLCASSPPAVRPAEHCWQPFPCPYHRHCCDELGGGHPLTELPGLPATRRAQLAARGICDISGVPSGEPLSVEQARVCECVRTGEEFVSDALATALDDLDWPVHHVRVGVVRPAIPRFRGTGPYHLVPYAWSDHVEYQDRTVDEHAYLCGECRDPREEVAEQLLVAAGERGSVCAYGPLEARVVGELAEHLPHLAEPLRALGARIVDLQRLVRAHYYHPELHGDFAPERVATVLGVPPCRPQVSLKDEYAAAVLYDESLAAAPEARVESQARIARFFERCCRALLELRRALRARGG